MEKLEGRIGKSRGEEGEGGIGLIVKDGLFRKLTFWTDEILMF